MNANSLLEAPSFRVGRPQFTSRSGVLRGHGKTPPFRTEMKCLSHRHVLNISTKEEKNENKIN